MTPKRRALNPFVIFEFIIFFHLFYINKDLFLVQKYAEMFVLEDYLYREKNSSTRARFKENCQTRGKNIYSVQGEIFVNPSNVFAERTCRIDFD